MAKEAKQMATQSTPVIVKPNPIINNPSVVNQVLDNAGGMSEAQISAQQSEEQVLALMAGADMASMLKAVSTAKVEEFTAPERDFWKPKEPGAPQEMRGVYLASAKYGRLEQHAIATYDSKGKAIVMRVNGAHGLTRQLKALDPGTPVLIKYLGETGTMAGMKFGQWQVSKLNIKA